MGRRRWRRCRTHRCKICKIFDLVSNPPSAMDGLRTQKKYHMDSQNAIRRIVSYRKEEGKLDRRTKQCMHQLSPDNLLVRVCESTRQCARLPENIAISRMLYLGQRSTRSHTFFQNYGEALIDLRTMQRRVEEMMVTIQPLARAKMLALIVALSLAEKDNNDLPPIIPFLANMTTLQMMMMIGSFLQDQHHKCAAGQRMLKMTSMLW